MMAARLLLATTGKAEAEERPAVSQAQAEALVGAFYGALNARSAEQAAPLLERATTSGWQDCGSNDGCISRAAAMQRWTASFAVVPDHRWEQRDMLVSGDSIIVRGQESGTPVAPLFGVLPTGRSFSVMTIDIHDVRDGKIVRTHHVEDWLSAIQKSSPVQ